MVATDIGPSADGGPASRVVLVDPAFTSDRTGHHWRLNKGYADLIGPDRCWFAVHRSLRRARDIPQSRLVPAFSLSFYEAAEVRRLGRLGMAVQGVIYRDAAPIPRQVRAALQDALRRRRRAEAGEAAPAAPVANLRALYRDELAGLIDRMRLTTEDHLVFTSLDARMGRAVLNLIAERGLSRLPALHLRLMYDETTPTAGGLDYGALVERLAATGQVGGRLTLHCETRKHARDLSRRLKAPVGAAPFPAAPLSPPEPLGDRKLTVAFLGEARAEKGFDRLPDVLSAFDRRHPDLRDKVAWRFHAGGDTVEATAARDATRDRPTPPGLDVRYRFGPVPPLAYERLREEADIVLALQDPRVYARRGSGVAQEAVAGGRPMVCLEGSSVSREPGAAALAAQTASEVADAVAEMASDLQPWLDRAAKGAEVFRRRLERSELVAACNRRPPPAEDPPLAIVVGPWWPQGGSARLMAMQVEALGALGYQVVRVHLAPPGAAREAILARALRGPERDRHTVMSLVVEAAPGIGDTWNIAQVAPRLTAMCRSGRVRVVVGNFPQSAGWIHRLPLDPGVARILETHDLTLDPVDGRRLDAPASPPGGFDAAVFVNEDERRAWQAEGQPNCVLITPPLDDRGDRRRRFGAMRHDLIFVGSGHERNRESLRRLLDEVLDHPDCADLSLVVAGDVAEPGFLERPHTLALGQVADLDAAYASARVAVAPWAPGGGIPSKVLGALCRGMPLVADAAAVDFLADSTPFAAADAADFRRRLLEALSDRSQRERLAEASRHAWQALAEPGRYLAQWRDLLDQLGALPAEPSRSAPNRV